MLVLLRPLVLLQLVVSVAVIVATWRRQPAALSALPRPLVWSACMLSVMVPASAAFSDHRLIGAGGAATALAFAVTTVAAALTVRTAEAALRAVRWLIGGASVGAVIGLLVLATGDEFWFTERFVGAVTRIGLTPRLTRPWSHANIAAMAIGPAVSIMAAAIITGRQLWHRAGDALVLSLLVISLVLTYSRGGLAGAAVGVAVSVAVSVAFGVSATARRGNRAMAVPIGVGIAVLGLVAVTMAAAPGWGGRLRAEPSQTDFQAAVTPPPDFELGPAGRSATIIVRNESPLLWPAEGPERVQLSARLLVEGTNQVADEQRWPLPEDVSSGEFLTMTVPLSQRTTDGDYDVLWDLLIDQEAYFLQFSDRSATSQVTVFDSPVLDRRTIPLVAPRRNLSRLELWRFAASAFFDRPLLGVGPMQLAAYAEPDLTDEQRFPGAHAHNLPLEALATWGLLGALPLFAMLLGGAYPAWRSAWRTKRRGDNIGWLVLAGLIASGVHATVEWQVNEVSAALPMAMLLGIGWALAVDQPRAGEGDGESDERDSTNRAVSHPVT